MRPVLVNTGSFATFSWPSQKGNETASKSFLTTAAREELAFAAPAPTKAANAPASSKAKSAPGPAKAAQVAVPQAAPVGAAHVHADDSKTAGKPATTSIDRPEPAFFNSHHS